MIVNATGRLQIAVKIEARLEAIYIGEHDEETKEIEMHGRRKIIGDSEQCV